MQIFLSLGKLELQLDNFRDGISYFEKAMKVLHVSHGEKHDLVRLLEESLQSAALEASQRQQFEQIEDIKMEEE